jgi:hypothetical protein
MMKTVLLIGCLALVANLAAAGDEITAPGFSGKVIETTNAAAYTYVLVDTGTNKLWAAAPQFAVKPGDAVSIPSAMPMPNYHSKTLNRDFDVVYFTGGVIVNGGKPAAGSQPGELPKNHPPIGGTLAELPKDHPPLGGKTPPAKVDLSGIKKATHGKTIQEIFADKTKLVGKPVTVRGRVVKFNPQIMGKNWLHIQDGTGSEGSNDLTVTTDATAKIGDTVLVKGTVAADKDFGAGYRYALLLEKAEVAVE